MTDDIVTRLRAKYSGQLPIVLEAADEIERLRKLSFHDIYFGQLKLDEIEYLEEENKRLRTIIQDIANAVTDEGIKPGYHKQQVNYVRTMWNPLWQAIGKAVKEVQDERQ